MSSPVAQVLVDVPLAHLDRPFDYAVPPALDADAQPGVRVRVRFAGKLVNGYVVGRSDGSEHQGRLQPLQRVVSAELVLLPEIVELTGAIARRYAGTRSDVLRMAVPARHATTEKREPKPAAEPPLPGDSDPSDCWAAYDGGSALLDALADGDSPRAVWSALPAADWTRPLAEAVNRTLHTGRGALVCVPDGRDLDRLDAAMTASLGPGRHVVLRAEAGPARRYAAFLAVSRGIVRAVIGTRAAAFAPVHDLGLVAIWDDGDDLYAEPRAPYPHTREVLLTRAEQSGCAAIVGAHARSVEAEYLLRTGWAREVSPARARVRERIRVGATADSDFALERDPLARASRLPSEVHGLIREALHGESPGPVLVQTPRAGYAVRLACDRCRTPASCPRCEGPLRITAPQQPPECTWCGTRAPGWRCGECGGAGLRAPVLGSRRTAEELGRAFPGIPVRSSSGEKVLVSTPATPAIVVATPGAEPPVDGPGPAAGREVMGYAAVVLLDADRLLARADLRAGEEALRRWSNAAALARPGARVLIVGEASAAPVQALVRWDAPGFARREIEERRSAHLPPASRLATLTGVAGVLDDALAGLGQGEPPLPAGAEVLGPVPVGPRDPDTLRYVVRVPRAAGPGLCASLSAMQGVRAARKLPHVRVQIDPPSLG